MNSAASTFSIRCKVLVKVIQKSVDIIDSTDVMISERIYRAIRMYVQDFTTLYQCSGVRLESGKIAICHKAR